MKRGASQAIAWVLLVGLSVSLAIFIGIWMKDKSKESVENIGKNLDYTIKCDDVVLIAEANCGPSTPPTTPPTMVIKSANLTNNGLFDIPQIRCSSTESDRDITETLEVAETICTDTGQIPPQSCDPTTEWQNLNNCFIDQTTGNEAVEAALVPFVNVNNENKPCATKKVKINC